MVKTENEWFSDSKIEVELVFFHKWGKLSPSRVAFYQELIDLFFEMGEQLRFRCISVDRERIDLVHYHQGDQELGFYKFYYQLLHHWILDFNDYQIFCDHKQNRDRTRQKQYFSSKRAERLDWIRATLQDPTADLRVGWDSKKKRYDTGRRVAIVSGNYIVVVALQSCGTKARFITAYVADSGRTLDLIQTSPKWPKKSP